MTETTEDVETTVGEMIEDSTETTEDGETTEEETTEVIKTERINAGDSKETTEDVEMTEALVIGIVQNVTTQTLLSEPNVIGAENLVVQVVEITVGTVMTAEAMTEAIKVETGKAADLKETTVGVEMTAVLEIGTVQSATTQTLHSEPNVTVVVNLVQAVVDVGHAEITVEDLLDAMTVPEHLAEKMVEDRLDEMAETEGVRAAMKTEAHTVKNALSAGRRNLGHLENHVAMAQVMHIIDLQNQSADVKMTTREGKQWVPNITTSMP